jgi:hypothetical protein
MLQGSQASDRFSNKERNWSEDRSYADRDGDHDLLDNAVHASTRGQANGRAARQGVAARGRLEKIHIATDNLSQCQSSARNAGTTAHHLANVVQDRKRERSKRRLP